MTLSLDIELDPNHAEPVVVTTGAMVPSLSLLHARSSVDELELRFRDRFETNRELSRSLVSFQANKSEPIYRWFKYREGFSKPLVEYFLDDFGADQTHHLLDPFAGTGAACFVANKKGLSATAMELLPVGSNFIRLRHAIADVGAPIIEDWVREVIRERPWENETGEVPFDHLRITRDAFSIETDRDLARYRYWTSKQPEPKRQFCDFLAFSILEEISYTRKDGQYLRWDHRSPRSKVKGKFDKGKIWSFDEALISKCQSILDDLTTGSVDLLSALENGKSSSDFTLYEGSNFAAMEKVSAKSIDVVVTSPPYCNRYDYTRTYALELAYIGCGEEGIRELRQSLLSCTVENRPKDLQGIASPDAICDGVAAFDGNSTIQSCIAFLEAEREAKQLNNGGIVKMVRGYFTEMAVHIAQLARVMKTGGYVYMVNDNVRYNGLDVPVDCILSAFAEDLGFVCKKIWVLPMGKGNSSQQMKRHGRSELRKCVYIWKKL